MLRKTTCWAVLLYGVAMIVLGTLGYYLHGSRPSLIAGAGFGVLLLFSAWAMFYKKAAGGVAATILALLLTATFSARYTMTHKPIPAFLAVLSGGMFLFLLVQLGKWKKA